MEEIGKFYFPILEIWDFLYNKLRIKKITYLETKKRYSIKKFIYKTSEFSKQWKNM